MPGDTYKSQTGIEVPIGELWKSFVDSGRPQGAIRTMIVEHYTPLVFKYANKFAQENSYVFADELVGSIFERLDKGVDNFDPDRGVQFETYIAPNLRGGALDYIREEDEMPRLQRTRLKRYDALEWEAQVYRAVSGDKRHIDVIIREKALEHGIEVDEFEKMKIAKRTAKTSEKTLRLVTRDLDDNAIELDPSTIYSTNEPLTIEDQDYFLRILMAYPRRQQRVEALLYLFEDEPMKNIGKIVDKSESRISRVLTDITWFFIDYIHSDMGGLPPSVFKTAGVAYGDLDGLYDYSQTNRHKSNVRLKNLLIKVMFDKVSDSEPKNPGNNHGKKDNLAALSKQLAKLNAKLTAG